MASKYPNCDYCGYVYSPLIPTKSVILFVQQDGTTVKLCRDCLALLGSMNEEDKDQFFAEMGLDRNVANADQMAAGEGGEPIL